MCSAQVWSGCSFSHSAWVFGRFPGSGRGGVARSADIDSAKRGIEKRHEPLRRRTRRFLSFGELRESTARAGKSSSSCAGVNALHGWQRKAMLSECVRAAACHSPEVGTFEHEAALAQDAAFLCDGRRCDHIVASNHAYGDPRLLHELNRLLHVLHKSTKKRVGASEDTYSARGDRMQQEQMPKPTSRSGSLMPRMP